MLYYKTITIALLLVVFFGGSSRLVVLRVRVRGYADGQGLLIALAVEIDVAAILLGRSGALWALRRAWARWTDLGLVGQLGHEDGDHYRCGDEVERSADHVESGLVGLRHGEENGNDGDEGEEEIVAAEQQPAHFIGLVFDGPGTVHDKNAPNQQGHDNAREHDDPRHKMFAGARVLAGHFNLVEDADCRGVRIHEMPHKQKHLQGITINTPSQVAIVDYTYSCEDQHHSSASEDFSDTADADWQLLQAVHLIVDAVQVPRARKDGGEQCVQTEHHQPDSCVTCCSEHWIALPHEDGSEGHYSTDNDEEGEDEFFAGNALRVDAGEHIKGNGKADAGDDTCHGECNQKDSPWFRSRSETGQII